MQLENADHVESVEKLEREEFVVHAEKAIRLEELEKTFSRVDGRLTCLMFVVVVIKTYEFADADADADVSKQMMYLRSPAFDSDISSDKTAGEMLGFGTIVLCSRCENSFFEVIEPKF